MGSIWRSVLVRLYHSLQLRILHATAWSHPTSCLPRPQATGNSMRMATLRVHGGYLPLQVLLPNVAGACM